MHILQAGLHSHEINSKKIKSLIPNISHTEHHAIYILYFTLNIITVNCMIKRMSTFYVSI